MQKKLLFLLGFLVMTWGGSATVSPDMVVKIYFQDKNLAFVQLKPLHLAFEDVQDTWARAVVKPEQLDTVQKLGYRVDVLYEDARVRAAERRAAMGDRWTGYTSLVTQLQNIASAHSDICRLHNVGQTVNGRDIYVMEITDNPDVDETDEAEVRFIGNIHGDEFISLELMKNLIEYLTDNYGTDPDVTDLVDNREIWVQPSVNPDGHEAGTRTNAHGVDMNRNHGYMYNYSGSGPFSEPELQVFRSYSLQRNFSMSLTFHGETTYFNYCWNFTGENAFDKAYLTYLGNGYTSLPAGNPNNYTVVEGYDWYQTNGDTNDWSYGCRGDFDVTIETPGYYESDIPADWNDNRDAILYIAEQAAYGISGVVTDADTHEPLEALVTVHQHPIMVYTDPSAGDYHRPLQAGTYDITVWANGHAPQTFTDIVVSSQSTTVQDVQLVANYQYYAMHVCWFWIDDYYESNSSSWPEMWPHRCLGPPDDVPGSLGKSCSLALDMGTGFEIPDLPGDDIIVIEADVGDGDEGFTLYGSSDDFLGPWVLIGTGTGTSTFDLSGTGLASVRYLKIVDDGDGSASGTYPGFDLDAIGSIAQPAGCGIIAMDAASYTCDEQTAYITVVDEDLNTLPGTQETVDVTVTSDTDPVGQTVTLYENGTDSDTFMGSIIVSETGSGAGYIQVDRGDVISAVYYDADCEGSPRTVTDTATAMCADPVLLYHSHVIDDASGDADGILDPGEAAAIQVTVDNSGDEDATGVYAELSCNHPEYIVINDGSADFPDIGQGASGTSLSPHFQVTASASTPDHTMITFTLTVYSDDSEDESTFQVEVTTSTFSRRYYWSLDTDPGWTCQGQWEWGQPQGQDGDPSSGYTGDNVYGYNLDGEYENYMSEMYLTSGPIDCSNLEDVEVRYMRWLGVESSSYDHASFRVSNNGTTWTTVWNHTGGTLTDTSWQSQSFDISGIADNQPTVYLRWVMGSTDGSVAYFGWNIDDIEIWGSLSGPVPTATPAPPTSTPAPTFTPSPTFTPAPPTSTPTTAPPTATPTPTHTPTMTPTPTHTPVPPTQTPTIPSPTPTTPPEEPTNTPIPTATPTPMPGQVVYDLLLNSHYFRPWDHFLLERTIFNPGEVVRVDEYILLDVYGEYWYWPSWSRTPDFREYDLAAGETRGTILDFWWPDVEGSVSGIRFWGALVDPVNMTLIGNYDMEEFGYGP